MIQSTMLLENLPKYSQLLYLFQYQCANEMLRRENIIRGSVKDE